jgi:RNA polymerase sigma-70 factor (ECF subfamily)
MSTTLLEPASEAAPALPDEEIVRRVRGGEHGLFETLMRRYNQRLYRVARSIVRNEAEAEDVMQQAYVNAFEHLDQFAERSRFSTWLTRITTYEALARLRRRQRRQEGTMSQGNDVLDTIAAPGPDPERQALNGELRHALEQALDAIPESYRCVFVLRDVEGLSTAEAAECLDVTAEVIKTRLHRARALLREEL